MQDVLPSHPIDRAYRIEATDGSIGRIDDSLIATETSGIVSVVVDKRSWLPGGWVLVPPAAVEGDWNTGSVGLTMTREEVRNSPEYL